MPFMSPVWCRGPRMVWLHHVHGPMWGMTLPPNLARLGVPKPYHAVNIRYVGEREDWIQSLVRAGLGCAVMPENLPLLPGLEMRPLIDPEVFRQISLATVAGRPHSPAVMAGVAAAEHYRWPGSNAG